MHVVHAFWSLTRGLCLWGEDSTLNATSPSEALRSARPHPFAIDANTLQSLTGGAPTTAILLLPSRRRAPLDSPEILRTNPRRGSAKPPMLMPWTVPIVALTPAQALDLEQILDAEIRHGAALQYCLRLVDFARDLAERGRVVPTVRPDVDLCDNQDGSPEHWLAAWRPVLQGPDLAMYQGLIPALPPVYRAEVASAKDLDGQSPSELVTAAIGHLTDAAVRQRLAERQFELGPSLPRKRGRSSAAAVLTERWLEALTHPNASFEAAQNLIEPLARELAKWDSIGDGQAGPARLLFRLVEPTAADVDNTETVSSPDPLTDPWRLEFVLQAVEDPTLMVPADQVWNAPSALRRWLDRPDELVLAELGRASAIFPDLAAAMHQARPAGLTLEPQAVIDFLTLQAGLLEQAGFGVLVPAWWYKRRLLGLSGSGQPVQEGGITEGMLSRDSLCSFSWQLAIGDEPLTKDELSALAEAKAPLVHLRGQWVAFDQEQLKRGLAFLERHVGASSKTVAEIIALAATHPDDLDTPLPVTSLQASGWLGDLLSGRVNQTLAPVEPPADFRADLRPYQARGLAWLNFCSGLGLGTCLADDMGLGKTIQLLALEALERATGQGLESQFELVPRPYPEPIPLPEPTPLLEPTPAPAPDLAPQSRPGPTLLICPTSLLTNWYREAAKFAPSLRVHVHHGTNRTHGPDFASLVESVDIVATSYGTAVRDSTDLEAVNWERIVLDEAQAVKNDRSHTAKAVRRLKARHRVALTGTPVENKLAEMWSIMDFLNPGILGSAETFRSRYARPIERYGQTEPAERLRIVTRPYILRRLKTDKSIITDLPDKIEIKERCFLTVEQASLYQAVVDDMMDRIATTTGIERAGNVFAAMMKLKQICNHPAQFLHDASALGHRSGKVTRLDELVSEILDEGDKALLFTQFTEFGDMMAGHLAARFGRDVLFLHGQTSRKRRDEMVQSFQSDDGPPLFLLSLRAGGTGLNLTAANHVIHLDRWWNPAVENQATDRAFRIGQQRNVQVRKFICTGTLEERIDDMIEMKKSLAELAIGDGEGWLTELSTNELRDIFTLSQEAIGE